MAIDIALMKTPGRNFRPEDGDRYLDFYFEADEWENFYLKELKAEFAEHRADLSYAENRQLQRDTWNKSLLSYPYLARVSDNYGEWFDFQQNEIQPLLDECSSLQGKINDAHAQSFLDKMTAACNEALQSNLAIALFCD